MSGRGMPNLLGCGGHCTLGNFRPDRPTPGARALPSGPASPRAPQPPTVSERDSRLRAEATAANLERREAALAPRRWKPDA